MHTTDELYSWDALTDADALDGEMVLKSRFECTHQRLKTHRIMLANAYPDVDVEVAPFIIW
jgi:hypothetical protein